MVSLNLSGGLGYRAATNSTSEISRGGELDRPLRSFWECTEDSIFLTGFTDHITKRTTSTIGLYTFADLFRLPSTSTFFTIISSVSLEVANLHCLPMEQPPSEWNKDMRKER